MHLSNYMNSAFSEAKRTELSIMLTCLCYGCVYAESFDYG